MNQRFFQYPKLNSAWEPAYQLKTAERFVFREAGFSKCNLKITLKTAGCTERKYRSDQPRVPAGNSLGGQWTRESFAVDPFNIGSLLDQYGRLASEQGLLFEVSEADIPTLAEAVMGWLGPGAFQRNSPNGAIQFFSADGTRQIRFDITPGTSHGMRPHINIEPGGRHIFLR